ncbi:MAG: ATP-binding protein [Gemmatimonadetes bacterium]|nr:ATP-binding protein [Gemmatimonadota bacterium]
MQDFEELGREVRALRDRLSRLSDASLRISESLDVDTVLREVADSARVLTGAGCSGIATVDGSGQLEDFVTSGLSAGERERLLALSYGPELWEYLRELPGPFRVGNLPAHLSSVGLPEDHTLVRSFLGTPIRHRGVHVGNFYLGDKESGQEFTTADEEILVLFASHAGAAIANARTHRDEQRARADLEALIDTTPVGVVVLDARSGKVASLNREGRRILKDLCLPGQLAEDLLEVLRVRRADGREVALDRTPLKQVLSDAVAVRVEEIVLEVPDGRKLNTLINATPIRSGQGEVESVVVTLQDLTPLEEVEVLRAEFLGMVSHELQAPLTSIKGSAGTLLAASTALRPAEMVQFFRIIDEQADHMRQLIGDLLDAAHIEAGRLSVALEPADLAVVVDQARNLYVSGGGTNPVAIDLPPDLPHVLADRQRIVQVLGNLISNAARHSPRSSPVRVTAEQEGVHVAVSVIDEGPGIPAERLPHLFRKFARSARRDRGRGVGSGLGLAICKGLVEAHGGRIWAESAGEGPGARFTFTIPVIDEARSVVAAAPSRVGRDLRVGAGDALQVLVVDDDPKALLYARGILEEAGHRAIVTGDPDEVPLLLETHRPDLVLLDLLLPGTDGIELMQGLPALADRPVIFMSVYGRDETVARALETGAADYLVKPFSPTELGARIKAAIRKRAGPAEPYRVGELAIHYDERRVTLAGQPVELTATEYDLLSALSAKAGRVSSYDYLLRRVWRSRRAGKPRIVRVYVRKLRNKLGDDARNPTYVFTVPRVGYRMARPGDG